jgi:hypothetical protein
LNPNQGLRRMLRAAVVVAFVLFLAPACFAQSPVYVVLFFHVPGEGRVASPLIPQPGDDAILRLAEGLHDRGVRATFQFTGEKARLLEAGHREDVIRALSHHDIGYHNDFHEIPPLPAVYLKGTGWLEGVSEFERVEGPDAADIRRIFGISPSCYSEYAGSWGPEMYPALVHMGIRVHIAGDQTLGLNDQPFWYGGMLQLCGLQRFFFKPPFGESDFNRWYDETLQRMDRSVAELRSRGGGLILTGWNPGLFVRAQRSNAVNLSHPMLQEPRTTPLPAPRSQEDIERRFQLFFSYVDDIRKLPGVEFVTARQLLQLYENPAGRALPRAIVAAHMLKEQSFLKTKETILSAAEQLLILLGMKPQEVEGPIARHDTTYQGAEIPRWAFERAKADVISFIQTDHRLPSEAWIGSQRLSILDFAATLAGDDGKSPSVTVRKGNPVMEKYFPMDPVKSFFSTLIPKGFSAPDLVELHRLQAWTLKPAQLK